MTTPYPGPIHRTSDPDPIHPSRKRSPEEIYFSLWVGTVNFDGYDDIFEYRQVKNTPVYFKNVLPTIKIQSTGPIMKVLTADWPP